MWKNSSYNDKNRIYIAFVCVCVGANVFVSLINGSPVLTAVPTGSGPHCCAGIANSEQHVLMSAVKVNQKQSCTK